MKLESALNTFLAKEFKKFKPEVQVYKTSDKYQVGIPDFILWVNGQSVVIECKNILTSKKTSSLLTHPFSAMQINFMKNVITTGNQAYGLIAVHDEKLMWLVPANSLVTKLVEADLNGCECFPTNAIGVASMVDYFIRRSDK